MNFLCIHNIYNIMLHIMHIQYTYDIDVWLQVQQHMTSLQQCQKTNALGKNSLSNMLIKTQRFLIYEKSVNRGWGWILIPKQSVTSYISESSPSASRLFSALYFSWALFIIHLFWADCIWNPLSSTHLWHKPVKMCRFITQRSKPAAANKAESRGFNSSSAGKAFYQAPPFLLTSLKIILVFYNSI